MLSLKDRLTEILINNKLITTEQLEQALSVQATKGGKLSDIIVELKFVKENELVVIEIQEELKDKARVEISEVQEGVV